MLSALPHTHTPLTSSTPRDDYFGPTLSTHAESSETGDSPNSKRRVEDTPSTSKSIYRAAGPSTLTLQLKRNSNPSSTAGSREVSPLRPEEPSKLPQMLITKPSPIEEINNSTEHPSSPPTIRGRIQLPGVLPTEVTPLLSDSSLPTYTIARRDSEPIYKPEPRRAKSLGKHFRLAVDQAKVATKPSFWGDLLARSINSLPAVFLGLLLNILDGVSYGMIIFPAGNIFQGFGPMGVSLFFVTYVLISVFWLPRF